MSCANAAPKASGRLAILGSELPFPFRARPSTIMVPGMPDGVIALHAAAG